MLALLGLVLVLVLLGRSWVFFPHGPSVRKHLAGGVNCEVHAVTLVATE